MRALVRTSVAVIAIGLGLFGHVEPAAACITLRPDATFEGTVIGSSGHTVMFRVDQPIWETEGLDPPKPGSNVAVDFDWKQEHELLEHGERYRVVAWTHDRGDGFRSSLENELPCGLGTTFPDGSIIRHPIERDRLAIAIGLIVTTMLLGWFRRGAILRRSPEAQRVAAQPHPSSFGIV